MYACVCVYTTPVLTNSNLRGNEKRDLTYAYQMEKFEFYKIKIII